MRRLKSLSLAILLFTTPFCFAENQVLKAEEQNAIEQIEVLGKKPLALLRSEYIKAQDDFFEHYNQFADADMKINCERVRRKLNTKVKTRLCTPAFYATLKYEERQKQNRMSGKVFADELVTKVGVSSAMLMKNAKVRMEELATTMAQLINANPELAIKYADMIASKDKFEHAKSIF